MSADELEEALREKKKRETEEATRQRNAYDAKRDEFVANVAQKFMWHQSQLAGIKHDVLRQGRELYDEMCDLYGKRTDHGQFSFVSSDGNYKVTLQSQEKLEFSETAIPAIEALKDVMAKRFRDRNRTLYDMLEAVLVRNKKGDLDPKLVVKLQEFEPKINDPQFSKALETLRNSLRVSGSSEYVRAYKKDAQGRWQDITLQFSAL